MKPTKSSEEETKTILARISPQLNERVEKLIQSGGYRNRSSFFEEAVRVFVEIKESQTSKELPLAQLQN